MTAEEPAFPERLSQEEIDSTLSSIKKMLIVGALFMAVGYLLILAIFVIQSTQVHPLIDNFAHQNAFLNLFGGHPGGAERAGQTAVNNDLTTMHQLGRLGATTVWMKLGGVAHILFGIFVILISIIRVLSIMPHRLSYEMERAQE